MSTYIYKYSGNVYVLAIFTMSCKSEIHGLGSSLHVKTRPGKAEADELQYKLAKVWTFQ
jgi:hypothetical protein